MSREELMSTQSDKVLKRVRELPNNISRDGSVWIAQFKNAMADVINYIKSLEDTVAMQKNKIQELERQV